MTPAFLDEARIWIEGGAGGAGCTSFRREKYVPRGGPDGGDGGCGGSVYLVGNRHFTSLHHFRRRRHFRAERGQHGEGNNRTGRSGRELDIDVPLGTIARDEEGNVLCEILRAGQKTIVAKGARGGRGNTRFKTSTNRVPTKSDNGEAGESRWIFLELKLLADVAIVGFPNAGKSTLIAHISAARPKIASYPFTTLVPNLGVVEAPGHQSFVVADVPGLIEGASEGLGMGHEFLRHVERSRVLLHLLDGSDLATASPLEAYRALRGELRAYSGELAEKREIVALNKADLPIPQATIDALEREIGRIYVVSAFTGQGLAELVLEMWKALSQKSFIAQW